MIVLQGSNAAQEKAKEAPAVVAAAGKTPATESAPVATPAAAASSPALATLGPVGVDRDEVLAQLQALGPAALKELKDNRAALDQWLRARLAEKALVQQARNNGWDKRQEVQRALQQVSDQLVLRTYLSSVSEVPQTYPSEAELKAAYEQSKDQFVLPAQYQVRQIFLAAPFNEPDKVAKARKLSQDLVKQARAPKADFSKLAQQHSQDAQSSQQGGDIGFVTLSQLVPEMRPVVQNLKKGQVSDPIQSAAGIHLLQLSDVREAQVAEFDVVALRLRQALRQQRQELAARAYLEGLLSADTVSINGGRIGTLIDEALRSTVSGASSGADAVAATGTP